MRNDDLVAKCSPRIRGGIEWRTDTGCDVVWTGYYARGFNEVSGREPAPSGKRPPMTYVMEHHSSRKYEYRTIDQIKVTNLYCGVGNGWDIVVEGTIIQHEDRRTTAQGEAEKLLDGMR
jgi:hypothetical protein